MSYEIDILSEIEEDLRKIFRNDLLQIISMLNRKNQLEDFLQLIGHEELIPGKKIFPVNKRRSYYCSWLFRSKAKAFGRCRKGTRRGVSPSF